MADPQLNTSSKHLITTTMDNKRLNKDDDEAQIKVSAIITTHNRLELLKRAVESVRKQTFDSLELIVVDDASNDGTREWCSAQDFRFIHIPKEESRGGNYARNLGIKAAKGEYIAFLDDDDYWLPEKTSKQVALMERKDCELVHCLKRIETVFPDGRIEYSDQKPNPELWGDMSKKALWRTITTSSLMMVKRQTLIDIGLFDENLKFWQEYDLSISLAQRKPFYFVPEPLCLYRIDRNDKGRLTNKYFEWKLAVKYVRKKHKALYSKLGLLDRIRIKLLYLRDSRNRAQNAGLMVRYRWLCVVHWILWFPFRSCNFIKHKILKRGITMPED